MVPAKELQDRWLVKVYRFLYKLQAERGRVKSERPIGIGADGRDMMDSCNCGHVRFRFLQVAGRWCADEWRAHYPPRQRCDCTFSSRFSFVRHGFLPASDM
jgi:hypothetical protein